MSSILNNASALSALQNLNATQKSLKTTQEQISTGLKVGSAADNAGYWSIATKMKSDNGALGAVSDALAISASMIDTFSTAATQTLTALNNIKNSLVAAQQPGAEVSKIQTDIEAQQIALNNIATGAVFNGDAWLAGDSSTTPPTGSFSSGGTRALIASYSQGAVGTYDLDTSKLSLVDANSTASANKGILTKPGANLTTVSILTMKVYDSANTPPTASISDLGKLLKDVDDAISSVTDVAAKLGGAKASVALQQNFVSTMKDALTNSVSALVDADMNEASTRLQALQTQQQLGVQALSIANQNSQMILKLFQS